MGAETSKQTENMFSQLKIPVAEGKRKGESEGLALSLQDVFSDSANLVGRQPKTSRPVEIEQGKVAQLENKETLKIKKNTRGGRKKISSDLKRSIKLQLHVANPEYEMLEHLFKASGLRYFSDFLRALVLQKDRSTSVINKQELIKHIDGIGVQIGRIGNNINQIAKYANIQNKTDKVDSNTMSKFNTHMEYYLKEQRTLINAYRALVRNKE